MLEQSFAAAPLRILHVVSRMDRAGIETWLMHLLRHLDRDRFAMDFLVHGRRAGDYEEEIRACGARVLYAEPFRQVWTYGAALQRQLRSCPPYDIVHSHVDALSGYPLRCAARVGVPVRIAHSHLDQRRSLARMRMSLRLFTRRGRRLLARYATHGLAASTLAGRTLFPSGPRGLSWQVLPCGMDLAPYAPQARTRKLRDRLGIAPDAMVIGHVGRFAEQKNHRKILEIAAVLAGRTPQVQFVLVGDGELRPAVEAEIVARGLKRQVRCVGIQTDLAAWYREVFDVFLFPSLFEGLGLVLVEAQAAGCPIVLADVVPLEADVVQPLLTRLSLAQDAETWADAVLSAATRPCSLRKSVAAYESVLASPFNIVQGARTLSQFYTQASRVAAAA